MLFLVMNAVDHFDNSLIVICVDINHSENSASQYTQR